MRKLIVASGALALSLSLSPLAVAEDWEAICLEEVKTADIPPEVTQDQINVYCTCYGGAIESDASLADEARELIKLPREERGDNVSEAMTEAEQTCQAEALGG